MIAACDAGAAAVFAAVTVVLLANDSGGNVDALDVSVRGGAELVGVVVAPVVVPPVPVPAGLVASEPVPAPVAFVLAGGGVVEVAAGGTGVVLVTGGAALVEVTGGVVPTPAVAEESFVADVVGAVLVGAAAVDGSVASSRSDIVDGVEVGDGAVVDGASAFVVGEAASELDELDDVPVIVVSALARPDPLINAAPKPTVIAEFFTHVGTSCVAGARWRPCPDFAAFAARAFALARFLTR
ncbi:MAG: hypothetical protein NTW76_08100 [Corynebacteriales bacterium]|nr:hypothetical protein [Mycobacteriales bacterium]